MDQPALRDHLERGLGYGPGGVFTACGAGEFQALSEVRSPPRWTGAFSFFNGLPTVETTVSVFIGTGIGLCSSASGFAAPSPSRPLALGQKTPHCGIDPSIWRRAAVSVSTISRSRCGVRRAKGTEQLKASLTGVV